MNNKQISIYVEAHRLSLKYPDRTVRIYQTDKGNLWIRFDDNLVDSIDGVRLTELRAYKNGEQNVS